MKNQVGMRPESALQLMDLIAEQLRTLDDHRAKQVLLRVAIKIAELSLEGVKAKSRIKSAA